jgi:hypothetical protein
MKLVWDDGTPRSPMRGFLDDRRKINNIPHIDSPGVILPQHFPKDFCFSIRWQGKDRAMAWCWRVVVPGTRQTAEALLYAVDDHQGKRRRDQK